MNEFVVEHHEAGQRLDKIVASRFSSYSRATLKKLIQAGRVMVNGGAMDPHSFVKDGDRIQTDLPEPVVHEIRVQANPAIGMLVLAETPDYIVINKPAGIVMHQSETHVESDTVVNGLLARFPEIEQVGEDPIRPGLVHRLDKEVSGVVIVARTSPMFDVLKHQFQERRVVKEYVALVHGIMSAASGRIDFPIARSKTQPTKMAAVPRTAAVEARSAVTEYTVEKQFQQYALLRVHIQTGRTHQIRVHLNAIGHPVVGDDVYRPTSLKTNLQPGRILLHAARFTFLDSSGQPQTVEAPLPRDFQQVLDRLTPVS